MACLYADENFSRPVIELLRTFGHDILTAQDAGNSGQRIPDEEVLAFAIRNERAVLTFNRRHFLRLHNLQPDHTGIIICTEDLNRERLALRTNEAINSEETLRGNLIRVARPAKNVS